MKKREFIRSMAFGGISLPLLGNNTDLLFEKYKEHSAALLSADEDFWNGIRKSYDLKADYINLENGYYSIMPRETLEAFISETRELNLQGSRYMRTKQEEDKLAVRTLLADFAGCPVNELIVTRNTTESMDTVISGIDWKPGDEAIMAEQDYGAMLDMFRQQSHRYGMVNIMISIPNHPASDEEIVTLYEKAITPKTKLIMVCHMINITGQVLPVKKICDMAHTHGVRVIVDGAHAFGHLDFRIPELGCDFYASSLHKWLGVPLGAGLLYVKQEHIESLWPLFADSTIPADDIRKLNHTGTHPVQTQLSIRHAITFHKKIGSKRKEARLRYLQNYWTDKVRNRDGIILNTPSEPSRNCGIANVGIEKLKPADMALKLFESFHIWTVGIDSANVHGCRITPHVFTTTAELDQLVAALTQMSKA